jgi:hypothetical protein
MTYLPTLAVLALSVLFGIYQLANFPPTEEIETYSVLSEAAVTFLALMGLFLVQKLRPFKEIYAPFMVGFSALFLSLLTDVLDEFLEQPDLITTVFEDIFQVAGYVLIVFGLWRWTTYNERMIDELHELATTDHLTGAYNRRRFGDALR